MLLSTKAGRAAPIVDPWFLSITLVLTLLCLAVLLQGVSTLSGWVLLGVSIAPVYATIYKAVLFTKAMLFHRVWAPETPLSLDCSADAPGVAFIIASHHEPFEVAKMTFDCAYLAPYHGPREIIVVDNSLDTSSIDFIRWRQYVESHAGKVDNIRVVFCHNRRRGGLKPGNVDLAQRLIDAAHYVVLLDVDSSLPLHGDFLARAVNEFENDDRLGVLQFHTTATNDHFNRLTGPVAVAQNAVRIEHLIRAHGGFAMFYGHNAMWRRTLLDINGRWLETYRGNVVVTEDLLKSVGAYSHGYTSRYLDVPTGEWIPSSLDALESMWMRWAYGGFQVLSKYFRPILKSKGLSAVQRIDLLTFVTSYALVPLLYPISLLWYLVFPPGRVGTLTFMMIVVPPLISAWVVHRRYTSELNVSRSKKMNDLWAGLFLIDTFIVVVALRAVFNFIVGIKQGWRVTAKGLEGQLHWWQVPRRNAYVIGLAGIMLITLLAAWGWHTGFSMNRIVDYLPLALVAANLLLCVVLYGRQVRKPDATIEGTHIDGYNLRNTLLGSIPLFHGTNALFQHQVALALRTQIYPAGVTVVNEGEAGREIFFVVDGTVESSSGGRSLWTMGKGSFFGGLSLIAEEPRAVTVRTTGECEIAVLEKAAFLGILRDQPRVSRRVAAQLEALARSDLPGAGRVPSRQLDGEPAVAGTAVAAWQARARGLKRSSAWNLGRGPVCLPAELPWTPVDGAAARPLTLRRG